MAHPDIIRAWKDEEYRAGLSEAERAGLPANPAGLVELSEADIDQAAGGTTLSLTLPICPTLVACSNITICIADLM